MNRRKFLLSSIASSAVSIFPQDAITAQSLTGPGASADDLSPQLRQQLRDDPLRPRFHLLPKANWMNDPCAPRYHKGEYHMFFQYNPGAAVWGDMHWAHATSPDLVHWKHLPVAIAPTPGSFDAFGIFTGSVLPGAEVPTVLYTGVTKCTPEFETIRGEGIREVQCLATSTSSDLSTWKKLEKPVISSPPPGLKVTGFRDPCPWKDGNTWYLIVGSGIEKVGGAVLLYHSANGREWEYLHPLAQGKWNQGTMTNPVDTGEMWECPDFFPLGGKHVLLYSTERKVYWEVGVFDKQELKFHVETQGLLDHGLYYAMKSMADARGRRILWGWVEEKRTDAELKAAGWAGCMALPRILTLGSDNQLRMEVPSEFTTLLSQHQFMRRAPNAESLTRSLANAPIRNRSGVVTCSFKPDENAFTLSWRPSEGGAPLFTAQYSGSKDKRSLIFGEKTLPLTPDASGNCRFQVWMDGSVIEVFVDGKEALTARTYAQVTSAIHIDWSGSTSAMESLTVAAVRPISADRLTS